MIHSLMLDCLQFISHFWRTLQDAPAIKVLLPFSPWHTISNFMGRWNINMGSRIKTKGSMLCQQTYHPSFSPTIKFCWSSTLTTIQKMQSCKNCYFSTTVLSFTFIYHLGDFHQWLPDTSFLKVCFIVHLDLRQ